jgi:hypothetical protein
MIIEIHLDAVASALNFSGGLVLALDALSSVRRTRIRRGALRIVSVLGKANSSAKQIPIQTTDGSDLDSPEKVDDWMDRMTNRNALIGFVLLTLGFGSDFFAKAIFNPSLFSK